MKRLSMTIFLIAILALALSIVSAQADYLNENNTDDFITGTFAMSLDSVEFGEGTLTVAGSHFSFFTTDSNGFATGVYTQANMVDDWNNADVLLAELEKSTSADAVVNIEIWDDAETANYYTVELTLSAPMSEEGLTVFTADVSSVTKSLNNGDAETVELTELTELGKIEFDASLFILVDAEFAENLQDGRLDRLNNKRLGGGSGCLVPCG